MEGYLNARDFGAKGSCFRTEAVATAGERTVRVREVGDLAVGDEVLCLGYNIHSPAAVLFERKDTSPISPRPWHHGADLAGRVEHRGYGGADGDWVVYYFDICPELPGIFRWTKDFGRTWHDGIPLREGWIELSDGTEVRFGDFEARSFGCTAAVVWSTAEVLRIEEIEGLTVRLSSPATRSGECRLMHSDTSALQAAIDTAIKAGKGLFIPNGRYRITSSLRIESPLSLSIVGESCEGVIIDNSLGNVGVEAPEGSCFIINEGKAFELKNITMLGGSSFSERDQAGNLFCRGGDSVYGFYLKKSNATCVHNTERVYIENCHARGMSAECFYARGDSRKLGYVPEKYCKSLTYMRCTVEDCARNAFNNNDQAECTSILYCKVKDVGGCSWEGASRFVKITGCYFSGGGSIALGNVRRRVEDFEHLGTGQHIITDNYFEGGASYGIALIAIGSTASQVTVSNNVFVNCDSNAIRVIGECGSADSPPENIIITSNSIDLTGEGAAAERYGIRITAGFVTVADNHIYTRGEPDGLTAGIVVSEDATRVNIHDNTLASLGVGVKGITAVGRVGEVLSEVSFYREEGRQADAGKPMLLRRRSDRYRGWRIGWLGSGEESEILDFDPIEKSFTLKEGRQLRSGEEFRIFPPAAYLPPVMHHNIIDRCRLPYDFEGEWFSKVKLDENYVF